MKKSLLLTGAGGMIGSHCVDYFIDNYSDEFDIFSVDDFSGGTRKNINPKCIFTKLDLANEKSVVKYFAKNFKGRKLDYLVHCAAAADEGRSFYTPIKNSKSNFEAFRNCLTYAIECDVQHVTFFSSMARYGDGTVRDGNKTVIAQQPVPFLENYVPSPQDPYAIDKVSCEQLIDSMKHIHDFNSLIIIPHNAFSPRQGVIDHPIFSQYQQYLTPYRNFIAIWMNLILLNKDCYIYGDGSQSRALSWVDDFNPIIVKAILHPSFKDAMFNLGGDDYKTISEWYNLTREITGWDKEAIHIPARAGEVKHAYCSHAKAKVHLGFENKTPIKDALSEMWEYFKYRGPLSFQYIKDFEINSPKIPVTWKKKLF